MKTASAPAKVILVGEHTALYANPVLAVAIDIHAKVCASRRQDSAIKVSAPGLRIKDMPLQRQQRGTEMIKRAVDKVGGGFDIVIESQIPTASGLGSSAAIASALVMALRAECGKAADTASVAKDAWDCENIIHTKSSGVDPFASTYGGFVLYKTGQVMVLEPKKNPQLVIAHCGRPSDTAGVVEAVEKYKEKNPKDFSEFLKQSEELSLRASTAAVNSEWDVLGHLMYENHKLLKKIGVSIGVLDRLVELALREGALGAKMTGAGRGGVMIALVSDEKAKMRVSKALSRAGAKIIAADISRKGAYLE